MYYTINHQTKEVVVHNGLFTFISNLRWFPFIDNEWTIHYFEEGTQFQFKPDHIIEYAIIIDG